MKTIIKQIYPRNKCINFFLKQYLKSKFLDATSINYFTLCNNLRHQVMKKQIKYTFYDY